MTSTTTFEKSIRYDRQTRDYRAELDGQLIGFYPSYHAAEVALDQVAYDLLADEQVVTADAEILVETSAHTIGMVAQQIADGKEVEASAELYQELELLIVSATAGQRGVRSAPSSRIGMRIYTLIGRTAEPDVLNSDATPAEPAKPTCEARDCQLPATHTIDTTPPTHTCCFHYSEEFTGVLCPCRVAPVAAAPDQPSCRGNGFGPCDQPASVGGYCPRCAAFLDKVFIAAMTDRALDTVRPAERFSVTLRAEPVHVVASLAVARECPICGGDHHVQRCPRIWLELRRPTEVFYEAAA